MIREVTASPSPRLSRRRRQSCWHPVWVIRRRFYCPRRKSHVVVWFHTIERRRDPGCHWQYRSVLIEGAA